MSHTPPSTDIVQQDSRTIQDNRETFNSLLDNKTGRVRDDVASAIRPAARDAAAIWKLELEKKPATRDIHKPKMDDRLDIPTSTVSETDTIDLSSADKALDIEKPNPHDHCEWRQDKENDWADLSPTEV